MSKILYGDYIYIQVAPATKGKPADPQNFIVSSGFYSPQAWAGRASYLNTKNYRNCLFQICPNLHSEKEKFSVEAENRYLLLKESEGANSEAVQLFGKQIALEKKKEAARAGRVELLNQKEKDETFGNALKINGKFSLRHVESNMFLDIRPRTHPLNSEITDVFLTYSPNTENNFALLNPNQSTELSENAEYGTPLLLYCARYNLYFAHSTEPYNEEKVAAEINYHSRFLNNTEFPRTLIRRQQAHQENSARFLVGGRLAKSLVVFENYKRKKVAQLKTGDFFRISSEGSYLTALWYSDDSINKIYFQSFESMEYRYNQSNTIFYLVLSSQVEDRLPTQELIVTANLDKASKTKDYFSKNEANKYYLRHLVSGCYLVLNNHDKPTLVTEEQLKQAQDYACEVVLLAKPSGGLQQLSQSSGFVLGFMRNNEIKYLTTGAAVSMSKENFDIKKKYYVGFEVSDEYLYKNLRPKTVKAEVIASAAARKNDFKYDYVKKNEIQAIFHTESYANQLISFLNFIQDFKTPYAEKITNENEPTKDEKERDFEKQTFELMNQYMRKLGDYTRDLMNKAPIPKAKSNGDSSENPEAAKDRTDAKEAKGGDEGGNKGGDEGDESDGDDDEHDSSLMSKSHLYAARELKVIDLIGILIHTFIREEHVLINVKELNTKYQDTPNYNKFDNQDCIYFLSNLLELLLILVRSEYNNHSYAAQYTRLFISALVYQYEGIFSIMTLDEKFTSRELLLDVVCELLWDEDLSAISQLNDFQNDIFESIRREQFYQGLYIRLLNHQAQNKAANFKNIIQESFVRTFLSEEEKMYHVFPVLDLSTGQLVIKFKRATVPDASFSVKITELAQVYHKPPASNSNDETLKRNYELAKYLLAALTLANSIAESYDLNYYQLLIKHYPYDVVKKSLSLVGAEFYEFAILLSEMIAQVHTRYLRLPINNFPPQIRIAGGIDPNYIKSVTSKFTEAVKTLVSDVELEVIKERGLTQEIDLCTKLTIEDLQQESEDLLPTDYSKDLLLFLSTVKSVLKDPLAKISLGKLRQTHKNLCKILKDLKVSKEPRSKKMILTVLNIFNMLEDKMISEGALELIEELTKPSGFDIPHQNQQSPYLNNSKYPLLAENTDKSSAGLNKVFPIVGGDSSYLQIDDPSQQQHQQFIGIPAPKAGVGTVVQKHKRETSKREQAYLKQRGAKIESIEQNFRNYISEDLIGDLYDLTLLKDRDITMQVINKLRRIGNFKNNLVDEFKKFTVLTAQTDIHLVSQLIHISFKLNEYVRLFRCRTFFGKEIPEERVEEIFKTVDKYVNTALFAIYDPKKHFQYKDLNKDDEERLIEGITRLKKPRLDHPFKIRGAAVNRVYQKIFSSLQYPETLLEILNVALENMQSSSKIPYNLIIRKIIIILIAYLYENPENQLFLAHKKSMILCFYNQEFIDQSCDVLLLFSEMLRGHKSLLKLPMRYLYDITWDNFWGRIDRKISENEHGCYLSAVLMSLPFLSQTKIEGKDPINAVKDKFYNFFVMLAQPNRKLDLFEICKSQSHDSPSLELPPYYYSITEFLYSWDKIRPELITSSGVLNHLFDDIDMQNWLKILTQPSLCFQFEIRNLICKAMARTCYGDIGINIVQDNDDFRALMYELFADLDAYISFMAFDHKIQELADYNVDFDWLIIKERKNARQEAYEKFQKGDLHNEKFFIYAEDVSVLNLWKEYIYEGLIELLNAFFLNERDQMATTVSMKNNQFPNLLSYYLHLLTKLSVIPCDARENPFIDISDDLQKASQIAEYKEYKDLILKAIGIIHEKRTEIKSRTRMSARTKKEVSDGYDNYIESVKNDRDLIKELSAKRLAIELGHRKMYKEITIELISALRRGFLGMASREVAFLISLLRKFIEKENLTAPPNEPIYMWEAVKIRELKKINYLQKIYQDNGLTNLIFRIATQIKELKVLKELLQLGLAYLYGGNNAVQEEFFEKFNADENSVFLKKLADLLNTSGIFFREKENERVEKLYDQSLVYSIELFADEQLVKNKKDFFERVTENYDPKDTVDALEFKENSLLLLLASFLQGLAEKQCNNIQNFFRNQSFNLADQSESSRNSINFLGKLRTLFNGYYKIHNSYNVMVGYKIVDVLNEFIQGDVPQNIEDVCKKTFLYDLCKLITEYNNQLHLLARGYESNPYQGKFMELKSKIIGLLKSIAESPNKTVIEMIKKYADLQGLLDVFEGCMYQYFGWTEGNLPNKLDLVLISLKANKIKTEDLYDILGDALNIYIIFRYLWVEKEAFAEETRTMITNSGRNEQKAAVLQAFLYEFCPQIVGSVEIVTEKEIDLIKYWFPLFPVCNYLLDSTKEQFLNTVDRTNPQTKIRGLIDASEELIPQMEEELKARSKILGFNANILYTLTRLLTNTLTITILGIDIFDRFYNTNSLVFGDKNDTAITVDTILNIINAAVALILILMWVFTSLKRHLSVQWERYNEQFQKEVQILPQAVQDKFQQGDNIGIETEDCELMLKYKGIYSDEFLEVIKKDRLLYKKIRPLYYRLNIWFVITCPTFLWHVIYLGISVASNFHPVLTALLIADIAVQSDIIKTVVQAVTINWKQFFWTLFLLFFVANFYTFVGFYLMQTTFTDGSATPNYYCPDTFGCLLTVLDWGLRNGGGIGDTLVQTSYDPNNPWPYIGKVVFELSFFVVVKVILLNLIFGMIVDAFGNLRDQKNENQEDQENNCFICGINRTEFERYMNYEEHTEQEHHVWNYLYFIIYLREKYKHNKNDLNEIENNVYEKYVVKNLDWIPVTRSISLERKQKELGTKQSALDELHQLVKTLLLEIKEIKLKLLLNTKTNHDHSQKKEK